MQYKTHQSFTKLLHGTPELQKVVTKVAHLEQINQIISSKLDPSFSDHVHVANLRDGILVLATSSPAWHHKLRFATLDLLSALRSDPRWRGLKAIDIRVDYLPHTETASPELQKKHHILSPSSAAILQQTAANISNASLAAALRKLAKHQAGDADKQ